jgi:hypothetical protein
MLPLSEDPSKVDFQKDFADLCALLSAKRVDFLIIGGYAVAFHGAPRFTGDLDILIRPEPGNVDLLLEAVREFGFPADDVSAEDLLAQGQILQLGRIPVQIHLMTNVTGVSWQQAWDSRQLGVYGAVPVLFIGRGPLIANKRATGRGKDLADVAALERPETR